MSVTNKPHYGESIGTTADGVNVTFTDRFMRFLDDVVSQSGQLLWNNIDKTGSNLLEIDTREHDDLQNIGRADLADATVVRNKHVSNAQAQSWTDTATDFATHITREVDETSGDTVKNKHLSNALAKGWTDHGLATSAHGASGNILGTTNTATAATKGPVFRGIAVTDASASTVSVTSSDISAAPASYDQTWGGEIVTLGNEMKGDINTLVSDVNAIKDQLNALLSSLRTSGSIAT